MGVRRFSALPYAHRPGIATYLNDWARGFAERVPESLWSATFYPEPEAPAYVEGLVRDGVEVFKIHVQVGEFHLDDPALDPVWDILEESGTPIVVHAGSGPVGNEFTGPDPLRRVLARFPRLAVVVAHMGAPEYAEFLALAERHERVCLDTTMVFTDFFDAEAPYPPSSAPGWSTSSPRCCWAATSRRFPTPTPTSSRVSRDSTWVTSGCGACAGTTGRGSSARGDRSVLTRNGRDARPRIVPILAMLCWRGRSVRWRARQGRSRHRAGRPAPPAWCS